MHPKEMSTELLLQSMGIEGGGSTNQHQAAAEPEAPAAHQQQFQSDSVAALFQAASLGQMGGQMPSTRWGGVYSCRIQLTHSA